MKTPKTIEGSLICQGCNKTTEAEMRLTKREENNYDIREDNLDWFQDNCLNCPKCDNEEEIYPPVNISSIENFSFKLPLKGKIEKIKTRLVK
jgi:DNA-directed RNA polymerase subunit M/transcription elongation factor TFIIS